MSATQSPAQPAEAPRMDVRATPELIAALGAALEAGRHDLSPADRFELEALRLQAMRDRRAVQ